MLDADIQDKLLARYVRSAGHDLVTANEVGLRTADDETILRYAAAESRVLITFNGEDFTRLHGRFPEHSGVVVIHKYREARKDLTRPQIVRALANLETSGWNIRGQITSLN